MLFPDASPRCRQKAILQRALAGIERVLGRSSDVTPRTQAEINTVRTSLSTHVACTNEESIVHGSPVVDFCRSSSKGARIAVPPVPNLPSESFSRCTPLAGSPITTSSPELFPQPSPDRIISAEGVLSDFVDGILFSSDNAQNMVLSLSEKKPIDSSTSGIACSAPDPDTDGSKAQVPAADTENIPGNGNLCEGGEDLPSEFFDIHDIRILSFHDIQNILNRDASNLSSTEKTNGSGESQMQPQSGCLDLDSSTVCAVQVSLGAPLGSSSIKAGYEKSRKMLHGKTPASKGAPLRSASPGSQSLPELPKMTFQSPQTRSDRAQPPSLVKMSQYHCTSRLYCSPQMYFRGVSGDSKALLITTSSSAEPSRPNGATEPTQVPPTPAVRYRGPSPKNRLSFKSVRSLPLRTQKSVSKMRAPAVKSSLQNPALVMHQRSPLNLAGDIKSGSSHIALRSGTMPSSNLSSIRFDSSALRFAPGTFGCRKL
eukprot:gnl/MRDRNA2_/MRDRNA2_128577_c0_seq1.p1 gnl/MRDRNA2_/MRDRNA2_128577_c0~~gnl/MRDRNA2_/MRDRNA2_128577_c0_seq1.p1  ORF type:complete len:484 (-),score=66.61 gnl/MRDRNA2_/MRDRNA2_128577_c0_seq1:222-1673(-)